MSSDEIHEAVLRLLDKRPARGAWPPFTVASLRKVVVVSLIR